MESDRWLGRQRRKTEEEDRGGRQREKDKREFWFNATTNNYCPWYHSNSVSVVMYCS
jgi:hypothetical protein